MGNSDTGSNNILSGVPQTYIVQILGVVFSVIFLKLASSILTLNDFGALLVARRWVGLIAPLLSFNLAISLSRNSGAEPQSAKSFLSLTLTIIAVTVTLLFAAGFAFKSNISTIIWEDSGYEILVIPVIILTGMTSLQIIAVAFWRGIQNFTLMNAGIFIFRAAPILVLSIITFYSDASDVLVYYFLGLGAILGGYHGTQLLVKRSLTSKFSLKGSKGLVRYGVSRMPGSLYYLLFFWFPVFFATHRGSLEIAAFAGVLIAVINLFSLTATPASLIILPKFAHLRGAGKNGNVIDKTSALLEFIFQVPLLVGPLVLLYSKEIIHFWFGPGFYSIVPGIKIISPGISAIMLYIFLRSVVDGLESRPVTNKAAFAGLVTMIIITGSLSLISSELVFALSTGLSVGMVILAVSILYLMSKSVPGLFNNSQLIRPSGILIFVFVLSYFGSLIDTEAVISGFLIKTIMMVAVLAVLYFYYSRMNPRWLGYIRK